MESSLKLQDLFKNLAKKYIDKVTFELDINFEYIQEEKYEISYSINPEFFEYFWPENINVIYFRIRKLDSTEIYDFRYFIKEEKLEILSSLKMNFKKHLKNI